MTSKADEVPRQRARVRRPRRKDARLLDQATATRHCAEVAAHSRSLREVLAVGHLSLTIQVHTSSSRSCFSSSVLDWATQRTASSAYCRTRSDSDIAATLRDNAPLAAEPALIGKLSLSKIAHSAYHFLERVCAGPMTRAVRDGAHSAVPFPCHFRP